MKRGMRKTRWNLLAAIGLAAAGSLAGWQIATRATNRAGAPANAIMVICAQDLVRESRSKTPVARPCYGSGSRQACSRRAFHSAKSRI
jgi:hypothetical protein